MYLSKGLPITIHSKTPATKKKISIFLKGRSSPLVDILFALQNPFQLFLNTLPRITKL